MHLRNPIHTTTDLQSYIECKKRILRDLALQDSQINSMRWDVVETKAQADRVFRHAVEKFLWGSYTLF